MAVADPAVFIPHTTSVKPSIVGGFILSGLALAVIALLTFGRFDLFRPAQRAVVVFSIPSPVWPLALRSPSGAFRSARFGASRSILMVMI